MQKSFMTMFSFFLVTSALTLGAFATLEEDIETLRTKSLRSIEGSAGKDVTILIGSTGNGKTTLAALLARKNLKVGTYGDISLEEPVAGYAIGSGPVSITSEAHGAETDAGYIVDMPGFGDTRGAVQEIVNAALIQEITNAARSLKVLLVLSEPDFNRSSGPSSLNAQLRVSGEMLKNYIDRGSFGLVINQLVSSVKARFKDNSPKDFAAHYCSSHENTDNYELLKGLLEGGLVYGIDRAQPGADSAFFETAREGMVELIGRLQRTRATIRDVSPFLQEEAKESVQKYFTESIRAELKNMQQTWGGYPQLIAAAFNGTREEKKEALKNKILSLPNIRFISSVLQGVFTDAWDKFQLECDQTFDAYAESLKAAHKEMEAEKSKAAEEERQRTAQEAEKKRLEAEAEAARVREEREALEKKQAAEERARRIANRDRDGPLDDENRMSMAVGYSTVEYYPSVYGGDTYPSNDISIYDWNIAADGRVTGFKGEFHSGEIWRKYRVVLKWRGQRI